MAKIFDRLAMMQLTGHWARVFARTPSKYASGTSASSCGTVIIAGCLLDRAMP